MEGLARYMDGIFQNLQLVDEEQLNNPEKRCQGVKEEKIWERV